MRTIYPSAFRKPEVIKELVGYMRALFWFQLTKHVTIMSLSVYKAFTTNAL